MHYDQGTPVCSMIKNLPLLSEGGEPAQVKVHGLFISRNCQYKDCLQGVLSESSRWQDQSTNLVSAAYTCRCSDPNHGAGELREAGLIAVVQLIEKKNIDKEWPNEAELYD